MYEPSSATPGMQVTHGMDLLTQALDVLTGVDPTELDPAVLGEAVLSLTGQSRRLGAVQSMVSDRFATSGAWVAAGAKAARAYPTTRAALDAAAVEKDERKRDSEAYLHLSRIGGGMWRRQSDGCR